MNSIKLCLLSMLCFAGGCALPQPEEGGANANDRTGGGEEGEALLTGMMIVSPDGSRALMQRNTTAVLADFEQQLTLELPFQPQRFVFSKVRSVGYALRDDGTLVALDLATANELWSFALPSTQVSLLRVAENDSVVLIGEGATAHVVDAQTGIERGNVQVSGGVKNATFLPQHDAAVFVGYTAWVEHQPKTALTMVNLGTLESSSIEIPNCDSKLVALPDESRALLSPTFCEEDKVSNPNGVWTNPDPVSVIDIGAVGLSFVRNLPGFGPVALSKDGSRAVAYLDTERMDSSMFDDAAQVPKAGADRYQLMVIDPKTQAFTLDPIGNALPRFAMTPDGKGMLVDSSVMYTRYSAKANAQTDLKIDQNGLQVSGSAELGVFSETAPFGYFDLDARQFTGFAGPAASLDRFVQTKDGRVFTLRTRTDGMGGDLFQIDVQARTTVDMGTLLRDIGILPDGLTLVLRIRQAALQVDGQAYTRENYCLSLDGMSCDLTIEYQDPHGTPVKTCDYHDC
jgi:hypothetical protein